MSQVLLTPGVYFYETDLSQYIVSLSNARLGIVTTASAGPTDQLTLVTSIQQLSKNFGIPAEAYPGLLVAREFLNAGGSQCFIVRTAHTDMAATVSVPAIDGTTHWAIDSLTTGSFYNALSLAISFGSQLSQTDTDAEVITATSSQSVTFTLTQQPVVPGTFTATLAIASGSPTQFATDDSDGNLVIASAHTSSFSAGTINYNTGVVTMTTTLDASETLHFSSTYNYYSTFNVQVVITVLDSNDNLVATQVLETFTSLNLANVVAALANSQYLDVSIAPMTFPIAGSYALAGGDDGISMIDDANYIGNQIGDSPTGLQIFAFPTLVDVNLITVPGISSSAVRQALIQMASETRRDCIALLDGPSDATVQSIVDWANANGSFSAYGVVNSTYAAIYFPWFTSFNNVNNNEETTPPTAGAVQAFARSNFWEAPAGPNRGVLQNCQTVLTVTTPGDREFLGQNRVNPISDLNGLGIEVLGQRTATTVSTSLDRIGARMTLLTMEKAITTALYPLLFEPNTPYTWNRAVMIVQPYLDSLKNAERIYDGKFFCDAITNTVDIINQNEMACICAVQLLKYAEIIVVNFQVTALGVVITENTASGTPVV